MNKCKNCIIGFPTKYYGDFSDDANYDPIFENSNPEEREEYKMYFCKYCPECGTEINDGTK